MSSLVLGSARAQFTITLSVAASEPVSVEWFTTDGTALAGRDYETNSGIVVFAPGEISKTVEVFVHGRTVETEDRVFYVRMLPPANAILADEVGACVIHVDTTGSQPVMTVVIPKGEKGERGYSAYEIALQNGFVGTEAEWLESLKPDPAEVALEVAPLLVADNMPVTAKGTETLTPKDIDTLAGVAGRIPYMALASKAIAPALLAGDNVVPLTAFSGDAVDPNDFSGFNVVVKRGDQVVRADWEYLPDSEEIKIVGASAGDVPIAVSLNVGGRDASNAVVTSGGRRAKLKKWFSDLAGSVGSALVGFVHKWPGAVFRTVLDKLRDTISVKDFGAIGDGIANDSAAVLLMISQCGYARFSPGAYRLTSCVLNGDVSFSKGAYLVVDAGENVTIRAVIESPRQFIFRGGGTYTLTQNDAAQGENVREVHASWFGAFTSVANAGDTGPFFAAAAASMGSARESIIHCDVGGYVISSNVPLTRGCWIKGAGSRRTVFKFDGDGYTGFTDTVAGLAKITDCNFELIPGTVTNRTSPFVQFNGNEAELYNIRLGETAKGIVLTGNSPRVFNIAAAYGADKGPGSDLIHVKAGSGAMIKDINLGSSSNFGPETLVRIGGAGASPIGDVRVIGTYHRTPSRAVMVEALDGNVDGVIVDGVQYGGFSGNPPDQLIKLETAGSALLRNVVLDKVKGSSYSTAVVTLVQGSSASMEHISIDNVQDRRVSGNGIELIRNAGVMDDVSIGQGVQLKTRAKPVFRSGVLGEIRVAPGVEKDSSPVIGKKASIPDDSVFVIELGSSVFSALVQISANASSTLNYGLYAVRAATSPAVSPINQSATMATAVTPLSGTTGADGKITLGVTDGVLYLENRSGAAITVSVLVSGA